MKTSTKLSLNDLLSRVSGARKALFRKGLTFDGLFFMPELITYIGDHFVTAVFREERFAFDHDFGVIIRISDKNTENPEDGFACIDFTLWRISHVDEEKDLHCQLIEIQYIRLLDNPISRTIQIGKPDQQGSIGCDSLEELLLITDAIRNFAQIVTGIIEA
jgi:hypothetical protein